MFLSADISRNRLGASLACSSKVPLSLEMLVGQFDICPVSEKNSFKNMGINALLGPFPCSLVDILKDMKMAEF